MLISVGVGFRMGWAAVIAVPRLREVLFAQVVTMVAVEPARHPRSVIRKSIARVMSQVLVSLQTLKLQ